MAIWAAADGTVSRRFVRPGPQHAPNDRIDRVVVGQRLRRPIEDPAPAPSGGVYPFARTSKFLQYPSGERNDARHRNMVSSGRNGVDAACQRHLGFAVKQALACQVTATNEEEQAVSTTRLGPEN